MATHISPLGNDWAVLCHLDRDGRIGFSELSRRIALSKESVRNAVTRLEQRGIIGVYTPIVNVTRLGLTPYVVFAQIIGGVETSGAATITQLAKRREIYWISRMGGRFDILFGVLARNAIDFALIFGSIQAELKERLGRVSVNTRLQTFQFPRNYLSNRAPSRIKGYPKKPLYFGREFEVLPLEKLDRNIINALAGNGRLSISELAEKVRTPRTTVNRHLLSLEQRGIIQGYVASVHAENFGYQIYRLLISTVKKNPEVQGKIYHFAQEHPNIIFVDFGLGEWDIELTCEVRDQKELQDILSTLRAALPTEIASLELLIVFEDNTKFQFVI